MEDTIKAFTKKPFRGVTTIQLFDKDTGKLVKEVVHENTYNQRLMYFTYLDEILQTGGRFMNENNPPLGSGWIGPAFNYKLHRRCYYNWARRAATESGGGDNSPQDYLNMYATMFLTNHTGGASAQGYPDGIPVAVAPLTGLSSYAAAHPSMGTINMQESYKGNDRIHLVVDFDTSHGNCTFDSLWIYPSDYERGMSEAASRCSDVYAFYNFRHIKSSALTTNIVANPNTCQFYTWEINYPYIVAAAFEPYSSHNYHWPYLRAIYVYNSETDTVVSQCSFEGSDGTKGGWFPTYYEAGTNTLKGWCNAASTSETASWLCPNPAQKVYPVNINMTLGTITKDLTASSAIQLKVNMTAEDLDVVSVTNTFAGLYYLQNASYLILYNVCKDEANNTVYRLAIYLANLNDNTFTKITVKSFASANSWSGFFTQMVIRDNLMFIPNVKLSAEDESLRGVVINITNGAIVEQRWDTYNDITFVDSSTSIYSRFGYPDYRLSAYYSNSSGYNYIGYTYTMYKLFNYKNIKHFRQLSLSTGSARAYEIDYVTAIWSTHNHLDEPITKTNQTTMKIQYDIIWDSITDVIVPAIL